MSAEPQYSAAEGQAALDRLNASIADDPSRKRWDASLADRTGPHPAELLKAEAQRGTPALGGRDREPEATDAPETMRPAPGTWERHTATIGAGLLAKLQETEDRLAEANRVQREAKTARDEARAELFDALDAAGSDLANVDGVPVVARVRTTKVIVDQQAVKSADPDWKTGPFARESTSESVRFL